MVGVTPGGADQGMSRNPFRALFGTTLDGPRGVMMPANPASRKG
jgi:hypothetical protein